MLNFKVFTILIAVWEDRKPSNGFIRGYNHGYLSRLNIICRYGTQLLFIRTQTFNHIIKIYEILSFIKAAPYC